MKFVSHQTGVVEGGGGGGGGVLVHAGFQHDCVFEKAN